MIAKANIIRVLDTSALIHDPQSIYSYEDDIHITFTLLEELDNLKEQIDKGVSHEARHCINNIERIIGDYAHEDLLKGVPIRPDAPESPGKLIIGIDTSLEINPALQKGIGSRADNSIINYALSVMDAGTKPVMLVSRDINMRLKARALGLQAEDVTDILNASNNNRDSDYVYTGIGHFVGDLFAKANDGGDVELNDRTYCLPRAWFDDDIKINYYWYDDEGHIGVITDIEGDKVYTMLNNGPKEKVFGITPRNIRQKIALGQLVDPDYDLNVLLGGAGSGKTLLAMAAALHLVMDKKQYKRVIVFRSKDLMDDDPGALPGTLEEKNLPLMGGVSSAVEFLLGDGDKDKDKPISNWAYLIERGVIEIGSVSHSVGASYPDSIIVLDEFQNFSHAQAKGMISRVGENSRCIILGNLSQIWSRFVTVHNSGLKKAVDVYSDYDHASVIMFDEVVRSRIAAFTEDNF